MNSQTQAPGSGSGPALNRRAFLRQTAGLAAAVSLSSGPKAWSANDKIIVGVMGVGGRGTALTDFFAKRPDVEIAWLCDPDTRRLKAASGVVEAAQGRKPRQAQDFRRMLEDRAVDVVINATPDHWHALGTILACQAGKDVYVEKPMAHNVREGRKMIEAARKYRRVVQVGTQTRSAPYARQALEYIQSGGLGEVLLVRVFNMMQHPLQKAVPDQAPPAELDYDLWCGPAAKPPYNPGRYWLNYSEYSCGPIPGDAVHQLDLARMVLGDPAYPDSAYSTGGVCSLVDGRDTPDSQFATFTYGKMTFQFESALWSPYMKKIAQHIRDGDLFPEWQFCATRIEVCGTKNFMYLGRHGGGWQVFDTNNQPIKSVYGRQGDKWHQDNFLQCVRTRARPNADVEQGHYSVLLCHLANISWRLGNRKLILDPKTETFPETPEANRYLQRSNYRVPWTLPDPV